jgi:NDP-sugar pyrophosphorylase family protein
MKVVVQCGGKGTRLRPYTMVLPKPLMPVNSMPVLELLLKWLRRNDVRDIYITTGYLGHLIRSFCGDGRQWSMNIRYTTEKQPLGTIGPLSMLRDELDSTFMVINGDVLTDLSIGAFAACHHRNGGLVTIATSVRETPLEFGVIGASEGRVNTFQEKPSLSNLISMGIYCMEPEVLEYVPEGVPFGFDDLMHCLLGRQKHVHTYRHEGLWLDIGRVDDFQSAQSLDWDEQSPAYERLGAIS